MIPLRIYETSTESQTLEVNSMVFVHENKTVTVEPRIDMLFLIPQED